MKTSSEYLGELLSSARGVCQSQAGWPAAWPPRGLRRATGAATQHGHPTGAPGTHSGFCSRRVDRSAARPLWQHTADDHVREVPRVFPGYHVSSQSSWFTIIGERSIPVLFMHVMLCVRNQSREHGSLVSCRTHEPILVTTYGGTPFRACAMRPKEEPAVVMRSSASCHRTTHTDTDTHHTHIHTHTHAWLDGPRRVESGYDAPHIQ